MPARVGPAPWNDYKAIKNKINSRTGVIHAGAMDWDLSTGWHLKRQAGWNRNKSTRGSMRRLRGLDGKTYKVYSYGGKDEDGVFRGLYDDYLGFSASTDLDDPNYQERLAYAANAFDPKNPRHGEIVNEPGVGHIARIEYAVKEQVLRVTFTNDDAICLFFRVPTAVAGELVSLARSGAVGRVDENGVERHLLGIRFWDYVRIRGTRHGARYPWEYEKHGSGQIKHIKGRHVMKLNAKTARAVFGDESLVSMRFNAQKQAIGNANDDEQVTVVLSDEEYAKLGEELEHLMNDGTSDISRSIAKSVMSTDERGNVHTDFTSATGESYDSFEDEMIAKIDAEREASRHATSSAFKGSSQSTDEEAGANYGLADIRDTARKAVGMKLEAYKNDPLIKDLIMSAAQDYEYNRGYSPEVALNKAEADVLKNNTDIFGENSIFREVVRSSRNGAEVADRLGYRNLKSLLSAAGENGLIRAWVSKNLPAKYAAQFTGRYWTPSELQAFANPTVEGNISLADSRAYKTLIQHRDWQGALNFLKSHKTDLVYVDKKGQKHNLQQQPYASPYDKLAED